MKHYDVCLISFEEIRIDARTLNFARTMANLGKKVVVIALDAKSKDLRSKYRKENEPNIDFELINYPKFNKAWQKWLYFYPDTINILRKITADIVFAEDIYSLPTAYKLKKKCKAKFIYDSREIYSEMGPLAGRKFKQKFIALVEKHYLKYVSDIIVTGKLDEEILKNILGDKFSYHLIMNLPPARPMMKSDKIRNQNNISKNKIILLYQGMLLAGRGIEAVIKALSQSPDLVFVLLGSGMFRDKAIKLAEELGVSDRVIFAGSKDYDQLHEWTCSADIGISLIEPITLSYSLALPNKMFEYIMAGLPVISTDLPAMKDIIDRYHVGVCISPNPNPDDIVEAVNKIQSSRNEYIDNCKNASKEFYFENQMNVFRELVK